MKRIAFNSLLVATAFFLSTCARNPVTGKKEVVLMSEAQELAMGQEADPQIQAQFGMYADSAIQRYVNGLGQKLAAISHRNNIQYHFRVIDSDVINAFAVPGGYIYITRGIMGYFNNEAQLVGVLGHEIGHVAARHTVRQQRNAMLGQLGLIAGVILSPKLAQFAEQASQGLGLLMLKFGRDDEKKSDDLGAQYSTKTGYDAHQMAQFFTTLKRQGEKSEQQLPEFLSTHPDPGNRNITVNELATKYQKEFNLTNPASNRNAYLQRIDGIIYGEDPKGGYQENGVFYHPEIKFQFNTPQGWLYNNSPQRVQYAPSDGSALLYLTAGQGNSLQEAAGNFIQQNKLTAEQSGQTTVNGFPAVAVVFNQAQQAQDGSSVVAVRGLTYFIQYNGGIFQFVGVSAPATFNNYAQTFKSIFESFRQLTDQSKINKKAERVRLRTVKTASTLNQALVSFGVPSSRLEETALLNGLYLKDNVAAGTIIKIIGY